MDAEEVYNRRDIIDFLESFIGDIARAAAPGAYFVDLFPWMLYLPTWLAPWKQFGMALEERCTRFFTKIYDETCAKTVTFQYAYQSAVLP